MSEGITYKIFNTIKCHIPFQSNIADREKSEIRDTNVICATVQMNMRIKQMLDNIKGWQHKSST